MTKQEGRPAPVTIRSYLIERKQYPANFENTTTPTVFLSSPEPLLLPACDDSVRIRRSTQTASWQITGCQELQLAHTLPSAKYQQRIRTSVHPYTRTPVMQDPVHGYCQLVINRMCLVGDITWHPRVGVCQASQHDQISCVNNTA